MSVSPASDVDPIALQLTINPGDRGGRQTLAMATLISPVEAVTAYHVLHSLGPESTLTVRFRNTEPYPVTVVATDPAADLALLRAPSPLPYSNRQVAERGPEIDEPWTSFLILPSAPDGMALAGTVIGREVVDGIEHLALSVSTGSSSPAGSSGAPVVVDGAVVGILARSNPDGTNWYALPVTTATVKQLRDAGTADAGTPIVGADSDAPSGIDRLGLETEIDTLSALVASRSTKTPMSIGLFGNWGSGKSFFMQKMDERIRVFRDSAAGDPESPYCKSIIQLWFNAWHYIDQSLWASLGAEIFEGLAHGLTEVETKKDGPQLEDQRTTLLVKRADAEAQRQKAQEVLAKSTADLNLHRSEIARIESQTDREVERSLGNKEIVEEVLAVASSQEEVKTALDTAAKKLGWAELNDRSEVAARQLKEILALASYWQSLVTTVRTRTSARWWLAVAAVAGLAVLLTPWFVPTASSFEGTVRRILSALIAFSLAASPVLAMAQRVTALVRGARAAMQKRIDDKRRGDLDAAERRRAEAEKNTHADLKELEKRRTEVEMIDQQLEAIKPSRQIVDFIRKRNQSTDYTQHFGVIARARQDFEELTRLMQLVRDDPTNEVLFTPVDRIVLYIDDLDRCPEDKVFEVLQAVHLLLAFPLFVVVVGVDPRWLFHSLRTRLRALSGQSDDDGNGDPEQRRGWQSTPLNYLEKIFQIPFTLRPMRDTGYEQLIDDLTTSPESKESVHGPQRVEVKATATTPEQPGQGAVDPERAAKVPAQVVDAAGNLPISQTAADLDKRKQAVEHAKRAHARLALSPWETSHMKRLFPLIPTPRATKRFVNVYRLFRGLTTGAERTALIGNASDGGYRPVLVLLAMVTGYPVEATEVMRGLLERLKQKDCPANWWKLLEAIRASHEPAPSPAAPARSKRATAGSQPPAETQTSLTDPDPRDDDQWDEMFDKLEDVRKLVGDSLTSKTMGKWAPMVARYSFASGRLLVADSKLAGGAEHVN